MYLHVAHFLLFNILFLCLSRCHRSRRQRRHRCWYCCFCHRFNIHTYFCWCLPLLHCVIIRVCVCLLHHQCTIASNDPLKCDCARNALNNEIESNWKTLCSRRSLLPSNLWKVEIVVGRIGCVGASTSARLNRITAESNVRSTKKRDIARNIALSIFPEWLFQSSWCAPSLAPATVSNVLFFWYNAPCLHMLLE